VESTPGIFLNAIFSENLVFAYFLGMCSYLAVTKTIKTAIALGLVVTILLVGTIPLVWLVDNFFLKPGSLKWLNEDLTQLDLRIISPLIFVIVITSCVQVFEMIIERFSPFLFGAFGIFLPLIAINCSILGAAFILQKNNYSHLIDTISFSLGSGLGWMIAVITFATVRERLRYSSIPVSLKGWGIALIVTGLMGIIFLGFLGINTERSNNFGNFNKKSEGPKNTFVIMFSSNISRS